MPSQSKPRVQQSNAVALPRGTIIVYAVIALISLAGLADATYLTVQNLAGETAVCGGSSDCFRVLGSVYSKIAGIPVAAIGAVAYFAVFTFATFAAFGYQRARTFLAVTVFLMFLATLWFLYVQAFLLHAFCRYCLFSAAITFLLTGLIVATPRRP
jgi:uncharacterized membrane protein